jgi:hypothetical protein
LFTSANAAQEKEKNKKRNISVQWCFKVCSPYSIGVNYAGKN